MAWIRNARERVGEIETARGYAQKPHTKNTCEAVATLLKIAG